MSDLVTYSGDVVPETKVKVKICGLTRRVDAMDAVEAGADFLGVVLVPDTPRARTPKEARALLADTGVPSVIVVADLGPSEIREAAEMVGASIIQLHGEESPEVVMELHEAGPWKVWKALRVRGQADLMEGLARFGEVADGLLLDAWHPGRRGGTGVRFSWEEVAEVRTAVPPRLLLVAAGGLAPDNVREAVITLRPQVVDVSSGVEERPGIKDRIRVEAFIRSVRAANEGGEE